MPLDLSVLVPIIVLGCNVLCLLVLLVPRSARRALAARHRGLARPLRACLAEALGTFALVFVACLTAPKDGDLLRTALAQGFTVAVMIAALGRFSGGHCNPAVTLGVVAAGRLHPVLGVGYWLAQFGGAVVAASLFVALGLPGAASSGAPVIASGTATPVSLPGAVALEAVATFFLVLVVFGSSLDERAPRVIHPLTVGLTVSVGVLSIGAFTGAALNPARFAGPALVARQWNDWVVYIAGPCLGGSLAAVLMQFCFFDSSTTEFVREFGLSEPGEPQDQRAA